MPKKKPITNHNVVLTDECDIFNISNTADIVAKFKFKISAECLANQLNKSVTYFTCIQQHTKTNPRLSKQKKYLTALSSAIEELNKLLENMGSEISLKLIRAKPDKGEQPTAFNLLERVERDLNDLYWRSLVAIKEISDKGTRPKDHALQLFITQLSSLFKEGTGQPATCGWDDIESTYTGSFYNFTLKIIEIAKIKTNITDIGQFIVRNKAKTNKKKPKKTTTLP